MKTLNNIELKDLVEFRAQWATIIPPSDKDVPTDPSKSVTNFITHEKWIPGIVVQRSGDETAIKYRDPVTLEHEVKVFKDSHTPLRALKEWDDYITVDFDGTIVAHEFPKVGKFVPGALETIKKLQENGKKVILLTMRHGKYLKDAVEACARMGLTFWAINENPGQMTWAADSRKIYSVKHIDDTNAGCPLVYPSQGRPYVDWVKIKEDLVKSNLL